MSGNWDVNFSTICDSFEIGTPQGTPQPVTGGLLHRMWRLETDSGIFAVKALNPEIMSRPNAKSNFRVSERVAYQAYMSDIRAVPAKILGSDPWLELNGEYVMVFDWIDGVTLLPENCTSEHGRRIGEILFQIHNLDFSVDGLEMPTFSTVSVDTWKCHIEKARRDASCWGLSCETLLQDISNWLDRLYSMRRSLDRDVFNIDERELGRREVLHTLQELKKLNEAATDYANWVDELSR